MAVTDECTTNSLGVQLSAAAGHKLRYHITGDANVQWKIVQDGQAILSNPPAPPRQTIWPPTPLPAGAHVHHGLAMAFGGVGNLRWKVELLAADDSLIQVVKDCKYTNDAHADTFITALDITIIP
jgi:hypothetical protein